MRIDEIDRRGFLKGLAGAAVATATGSAIARVVPGEDSLPGVNRLTGKPNTPQDQSASSAQMPNQNLETAEKVERTADGFVLYYDGKEYRAVEVPKDAPTPRGAKTIKINQAQMGIRGIGNYTAYLLPDGRAYIYSK